MIEIVDVYTIGILGGLVLGITLMQCVGFIVLQLNKRKVKGYLLSLDEREIRRYLTEIGLP